MISNHPKMIRRFIVHNEKKNVERHEYINKKMEAEMHILIEVCGKLNRNVEHLWVVYETGEWAKRGTKSEVSKRLNMEVKCFGLLFSERALIPVIKRCAIEKILKYVLIGTESSITNFCLFGLLVFTLLPRDARNL